MEADMREMSLFHIFQRNARNQREALAVKTGPRRLTFGALHDRAASLAAGLAGAGVAPGDRIAVLALNHPDCFTVLGAAALLGAVVVPLNWRLAVEEIGYILADARPAALIADSHHREMVERLAAQGEIPALRLGFDGPLPGGRGLEDLLAAPREMTPAAGDAPFCLIYTAAVGGRPRGATLSHANFIYSNLQTVATLGLGSADTYLNMLPLFHITGMNLALAVMHAGGANAVMERFDPAQVVQQVRAEGVTLLGSFPPILSRLLEQLGPSGNELETLRHVVGLDQPDTIRAFQSRTGSTFWILYGQTETSGFVTFAPFDDRPGSAGRQGLLSIFRVVDESGRDTPVGESGEIVVRGPLVFQGYWGQDALNRQTFRDGWHHTGDLGRVDADGFLWFGGRLPEKELIKPGGENVYPAEVEQVIRTHPAVAEVAVIGVPDPEFGEGVKAVCALKPGQALTARELIDFVGARIARYKKPRYVEFVEALPRAAGGGVDRAAVKQRYGAP